MTLKERLLAAAGYRVRTGLGLARPEPTKPRVPRLSVIVPTRNRPFDAVRTVESVLHCEASCEFEVIVIDQGDDSPVENALRAFDGEERLHYVRSAASSAAQACNEGAALARGEIIAFAGDDCTVPRDWLTRIETSFAAHPNVALVLGDVVTGAHARRTPAVPSRRRARVVTGIPASAEGLGIDANLSARRLPFREVGGFDEAISPGGRSPSAENLDLALRFLLVGWSVLDTPRVVVVRHGLRKHHDERAPATGDWGTTGLVHAKLMRTGGWRMISLLAWSAGVRLLGRRPESASEESGSGGLHREFEYWRGLVRGLRRPIDASTGRLSDLPGGKDEDARR